MTPGVLVQIQKIRNIGMPQKNQEDGDGGGSDDGVGSDDYELEHQAQKIEKFENKYLEATELGPGAKKKTAWGGKEQNRMFKYLLTDGKTDIMAVELEKIAYIHFDSCQVGSKLRLTGKIEVRRGIHMIKNANVEVVWGNKDPGFKTSGCTSFTLVQKLILNPRALERKSILT